MEKSLEVAYSLLRANGIDTNKAVTLLANSTTCKEAKMTERCVRIALGMDYDDFG